MIVYFKTSALLSGQCCNILHCREKNIIKQKHLTLKRNEILISSGLTENQQV
jgi:hypothetical protein